jgi:hypothetical protein
MSEDFGTVDDYTRALQTVLKEEGVPEKHLDILRAHCEAPDRTSTANKLAQAVGYANGNAVNLQYGTLAHRVATELGVPEPPKGFWLFVLVDWAGGFDSKGHTRFGLRKPVVEALRRLGYGWAGTATTSRRSANQEQKTIENRVPDSSATRKDEEKHVSGPSRKFHRSLVMDALSLIYGNELFDDLEFCRKHAKILDRYSHGIMTLRVAPIQALEGLARNPGEGVPGWTQSLKDHPQDYAVLQEFFRRLIRQNDKTRRIVPRR